MNSKENVLRDTIVNLMIIKSHECAKHTRCCDCPYREFNEISKTDACTEINRLRNMKRIGLKEYIK